MRIDQARIFEMVKAYEKGRVESGRRQGQDRELPLAIRDEVIISTEAKRLQIVDRVLSQVVERLRNLPPSQNPDPEVDMILEEAARDIEPTLLGAHEKARIRKRSLEGLRSEGGSR